MPVKIPATDAFKIKLNVSPKSDEKVERMHTFKKIQTNSIAPSESQNHHFVQPPKFQNLKRLNLHNKSSRKKKLLANYCFLLLPKSNLRSSIVATRIESSFIENSQSFRVIFLLTESNFSILVERLYSKVNTNSLMIINKTEKHILKRKILQKTAFPVHNLDDAISKLSPEIQENKFEKKNEEKYKVEEVEENQNPAKLLLQDAYYFLQKSLMQNDFDKKSKFYFNFLNYLFIFVKKLVSSQKGFSLTETEKF